MDIPLEMKHWLFKWILRLEKQADRSWYPFWLACLAAIDLFIVFIPVDGIFLTSALLQPKRRAVLILLTSVGSAIGSVLFAVLIQVYGDPLIHYFFHDKIESASWRAILSFFNAYGLLALTLVAASPLPQQIAILFCALAQVSLPFVFLAVLMGRTLKYCILGWSAKHGSRLLHWWRRAEKEKAAIESEAEQPF